MQMAKILLDALNDLVLEEGISEAELQILALALEGKSPTEIKTSLGSSSENAVQKRLARIYTKFRISGAGPGKLAKLQKILLDRLQAQHQKQRVLLYLAGHHQPQQVEGIRSIFKHPQIEILSLDAEITADSPWLTQVNKSLKDTDFCIVSLTQTFLESPCGHFAIGFLAGRIQNLKLLCFSPTALNESCLFLPLLDGTDKATLAQLLGEIIGNVPEATDWVNFKLSTGNWLETFQSAPLPQPIRDNRPDHQLVVDAGRQLLITNPCSQTNPMFRELMTEILADVGKQVAAVGSRGKVFAIPLELYPRYLVSLQQRFQPVVKAVAVMQSVEHFWGSDEGDEIGETANRASERLFVFPNETSFNKSASFLLKHALHYNVYVTTWETYKPLAAEYSMKDRLTQWKDKDHSLPTREYAILKTAEQGQLLAWYDQDTIDNNRNARFVNFSAVPEQAALYEEAFDRLVKAQGVFQFRSNHFAVQDGVIEALDQLKNGLFRQTSPTNFRITPERWLDNLQRFRNELIHKNQTLQQFRNELIHTEQTLLENRKNAVIQTALQRVREMLHAQIVSIFLFTKDGRLHRVGIEGVDRSGQSIDHQTFYPAECYAVGESFTGRAAVPAEDGYGKPQWTNRLHQEDLGERTKVEYAKKFELHCAIAVPLNGQNRTYGVLQVINKVDSSSGELLDYCSFAPNEIPLLSAIGSFVATAISNFRRDKQNKLYADLSNLLVRSPSAATELQETQETYDRIVQRLISEETAFEVCILRVKTRGELVVRARAAVERVKLATRQDKAIQSGDGLVGKAFQLGQPTIVENISDRIDQFKSKDWIQLNQFQSFGCFPLIYKEDVVGTLSLYTAYQYQFHPGTKEFLGRVSFLIAAFIGKMIESEVVRDVVSQLDESEQSIDPVNLARARRELNDTFIRSAGSEVDAADPTSSTNSGDLIYLD